MPRTRLRRSQARGDRWLRRSACCLQFLGSREAGANVAGADSGGYCMLRDPAGEDLESWMRSSYGRYCGGGGGK